MNYDNRMGVDLWLSERAQELINEGTLTEIMNLIESDIKDEWGQHPEAERREALYHELQALSRVRLKFATLVNQQWFRKE